MNTQLSPNPNLENALRLILNPLTGIFLYGVFLSAWISSMSVYETFMDAMLYPMALMATFILYILYVFIGGLTISHWKDLTGEMKVLIPAIGFMALLAVGGRILQVFSVWSIALWFFTLTWLYAFHVTEQGIVYTKRWMARVLRWFGPTYLLGLSMQRSCQKGSHVWGVLKTLQVGLVFVALTVILDISFRIWG